MPGDAMLCVFRRTRIRRPTKARVRQRCPVNYESSHSLLSFILNAPVSFDFPSLFPTLPLPSADQFSSRKKTSRKKRASVKFPDPLFRFQTITTTLFTFPSYYHSITTIPRSNSTRAVVSNISHHTFYNSPSPSSWETTPLRSISTRSLTGCLKVRFSS